MQPAYQPQILPNNFSKELLAKRTTWEKTLGIKKDEMLTFRAIGTGNTNALMIKSTARGSENSNFEPMKPVPMSHMIPMQESIPDANAPGGFVQLIHYDGGYAPNKKPAPVVFKGFDETVINVVPEENQALYDFLTFSPRLKDGPQKSRQTPKFELLRPDAEIEANWEDEQALAAVIIEIGDATMDVLKFLAPKLFLPSEASTEQRMRKNFADYAKLRASNVQTLQALLDADETLIYQQVEQAVQADVVKVDRDKAMWVLSQTQAPITPASPERNNLDQLVAFLQLEEGQVTLKQILALLGTPEVAAEIAKNKGGRPKKNAATTPA